MLYRVCWWYYVGSCIVYTSGYFYYHVYQDHGTLSISFHIFMSKFGLTYSNTRSSRWKVLESGLATGKRGTKVHLTGLKMWVVTVPTQCTQRNRLFLSWLDVVLFDVRVHLLSGNTSEFTDDRVLL